MQPEIIIIGGGSAGCALAYRLAQAGRRVVLLEGGRSDRHPFIRVPAGSGAAIFNSRFNWMHEIEPDSSRGGKVDMWPAGRVLGGGSSINGMMFVRAHPRDYDDWADAGCQGWDYASLLPVLKRMENNERGADNFRGTGGPQNVSDVRARNPITDAWLQACVQAGIARNHDLNGEDQEGVDYVQTSQRRGLRHSTAIAYIHDQPSRENLEVILEAQALRIECRDGRAKTVHYRHGDETRELTASAGIVVSAGAIASPQLLMLSGIGPERHVHELGIGVVHDVPEVGGNLQEHPAVPHGERVSAHTLGSRTGILWNLWHGLNFALRRRGPLTTGMGHAQAFVRTSDEYERANVQIIMSPFAIDFDDKGPRLSRERHTGGAIGVMRPHSRGRISLRSADPLDKPRIEHQLLGDERDVAQLLAGIQMHREILQQPALEGLLVDERLPGRDVQSQEALEAFIRDEAFPMYHPVGTCRMGSDEQSVVDPKLKVRGVDGLWVCDASIMPTLTSGNTNATAIMIGEYGADLINSQLD